MHRSARSEARSFLPAPSRAPGDSQALSRSAAPPGQRSSDKGITFDRLGVERAPRSNVTLPYRTPASLAGSAHRTRPPDAIQRSRQRRPADRRGTTSLMSGYALSRLRSLIPGTSIVRAS